MEISLKKAIETPRLSQVWQRLKASRWLWVSLAAFTVSRLGVMVVAYLAAPLLADNPNPAPYHLRPPDNTVLDVLGSRWDTGFYISVAEEGYFYTGVPLPSVAFFPLLPLIMRLLTPLLGDALLAGVVASNAFLLLATFLLYRLVEMEWGTSVADRAVWYLLIFPTAFFGSAIYTESLFLFTAIGALYFARRGYWESAALLAVAASLTRLVGLIVAPMLLLEWWMQRRERAAGERPPWWGLLAPAAAPLGTGAYMLFLARAFGDPLAFAHASSAWGRVPQSPLATIAELFVRPAQGWLPALLAGQIHLDNWIDFSFITLFLLFALILLWQKRWSEGSFVLLGTLLPFSSGLLMSQRRYVWVLFPAFILLARWGGHPWVDRAITTLFLVGLALFTALFANGYWVA